MDTKLRIDLSQGILEVEGSEKFVSQIYQDFKESLMVKLSSEKTKQNSPQPKQDISEKTHSTSTGSKKKQKSSVATKMPSLVKDLDLLGKEKGKSLKEFVSSYSPKYALEWNLLFTYYLQKVLEIPAVGIDHIYTCYKHVGTKPPTNLYQSLIDTSRKRGSINTDSVDAITVTIVGENLVEHEMPRNEGTDGNA